MVKLAAYTKQHAVLLAILVGAFSLVLTNSGLNILLPSFVELYGVSAAVGGWIIILYMLAMTVTMPLTSLIVDRFGRKRTYLIGIGLYGLFSIVGALFSQSIAAVLLVRLMHGIAAGLMIPLSLVLLFDIYGKEVRGRVVGVWGMLLTIAPAIGPTLGGFVIEYGELKHLFWFNVPFALFSFVLCCTHIRFYEPALRKTIDKRGIVLMAGGLAALSLGIQLFASAAVPKWLPCALLAAGAFALIRFIREDSKKREPFIRYKLLRGYPVFTLSLIISTVQDSVMFGVIFIMPLLFQEVLHLSPTVSGAMFIPTALCTSLFVWIGGMLVDSGKSFRFIGYGIGFIAVSVGAFAFVPQNVSFLVIIVLMAFRGIGNGLSDMTITAIGMNALPEEDLHEGTALSNTIQRLVSSFTVMLLALYYELSWQWRADSGWSVHEAKWMGLREECLALGVLMLLTLPIVGWINRKKVKAVAEGTNCAAGS
jgi:MFS transporter, DHA2 family, multidrug resistance protein